MAIQDSLTIHLGPYHAAVLTALARLEVQQVVPRIWSRDHTVWKPEPTEITNRLGWLEAPEDMTAKVGGIGELVTAARAAGYTDALLLGMGSCGPGPDCSRSPRRRGACPERSSGYPPAKTDLQPWRYPRAGTGGPSAEPTGRPRSRTRNNAAHAGRSGLSRRTRRG